ncbi:MAG: sigma-70 family RNA polymerase sigma factor [Prevotella sp.]|nr:sigma-70 family RNA polymerase sigma factor [Prevotella sp.]
MIVNFEKRNTLSDKEYVVSIQNGEERVMEQFFRICRRYFMDSYRQIFRREDIKEDIFQQSFVKLWAEIETRRIFIGEDDCLYRFDKKGNIRKFACSLKTFLLDIAKNDYRDWLRKDRLVLTDDMEIYHRSMEIKQVYCNSESQESMRERIVTSCMFELPSRCKDILTMFYCKGMSLDEIIKARGEKHTSKNGLKSGKYKCMELLKAKVRETYKMYHLKY